MKKSRSQEANPAPPEGYRLQATGAGKKQKGKRQEEKARESLSSSFFLLDFAFFL